MWCIHNKKSLAPYCNIQLISGIFHLSSGKICFDTRKCRIVYIQFLGKHELPVSGWIVNHNGILYPWIRHSENRSIFFKTCCTYISKVIGKDLQSILLASTPTNSRIKSKTHGFSPQSYFLNNKARAMPFLSSGKNSCNILKYNKNYYRPTTCFHHQYLNTCLTRNFLPTC